MPRRDSVGWAMGPRPAPRGLQVLLGVVLVVLVGLVSSASRRSLLPAFERGLLAPGVLPERVPEGEPVVLVPTPGFDPAVSASGPLLAIAGDLYWTPELAEERLDPLPEVFDRLMAAGRRETREYRRVRPELFANRWNPWLSSWRNRLAPIRDGIPPRLYCQRGEELVEPLVARCLAMNTVGDTLWSVGSSESVAEAGERFDRARDQLAAWREAEEARLEEEARLAEEAAAAEAADLR